MDIFDQIQTAYFQLTAAERRVADYVLAAGDRVQFMSITQLAAECGSAEATVSRFCRGLGLKGFNAFKIAIAKSSAAAGKAPAFQETSIASQDGRRASVKRLAEEAISQTLEYSTQDMVMDAVKMLEKARRVSCFGSGGSMIMAEEFAHLFSTVSHKFTAISDSHRQMSAVATMDERDVIVLFSYSGATTVGLQLLEAARNRGVKSILVTRFNESPAAKLVDVVLSCGSNEGPFQLGSIPAKIAQLIVTDLVFQEYCHRNREECVKNIQQIASALSAYHL